MSFGTLAPPPIAVVAATFPWDAVEAQLKAELIEAVKAEASIKGMSLPPSTNAIAQAPFQIDSLVAVSILCAVEPIVGFELPDIVVRSGGYGSVEQAVDQLLPRIETQWKKKKGLKT